MPDLLSKEGKDIIKSLDAEIILVSKEQEGFLGGIALSEHMAVDNKNIFFSKQFENCYNAEVHENATAKDGCSCNLLILHRMLLLVWVPENHDERG